MSLMMESVCRILKSKGPMSLSSKTKAMGRQTRIDLVVGEETNSKRIQISVSVNREFAGHLSMSATAAMWFIVWLESLSKAYPRERIDVRVVWSQPDINRRLAELYINEHLNFNKD